MKRLVCLLLFGFFVVVIRSATAQSINWNMSGAQQVEANFRTLSTQDQQGILHSLREKPENLRVRKVSVAAGSLFLVQGVGNICGAANCEFWVLDSNYKILLEKVTQVYKLQSTTHIGLPDILTSMHGSAFESGLSYWQFQGKRYKGIACADSTYLDRDGSELKKPRVTHRPCGTGG